MSTKHASKILMKTRKRLQTLGAPYENDGTCELCNTAGNTWLIESDGDQLLFCAACIKRAKSTHGGKRPGAGRKPNPGRQPLVSINLRVPADLRRLWDAKRGTLSGPAFLAKLMKWKP